MENANNNCLDDFYKLASCDNVAVVHSIPGANCCDEKPVNMQALKHYAQIGKGYMFNPATGNYHSNHE
jgi:hypothetical protein